ncbi:MAG: phosphoglucosamine mutase [Candidatus Eremiobacteraeota bacterium]|nr:phosphoglucosamine mutase [Candidatus Eremiobacteraeota bacterium]
MSGPRLFGTDGVRGVANADLTPEIAMRLARAGAYVVGRGMDPNYAFVIGRDTRLSGTMLEAAVVAGILSMGRDTLALGVVPTPGVARIVPSLPAAGGVMISASHNPVEDNGIKFFGPDGYKLDDAAEHEIERLLEDDAEIPRPTGLDVGIGKAAHGFVDRYFATLVEAGSDLSGMTVVVDAACGAAFEVGPRAFARLGARVVTMNCEPDGSLINVGSGSTDMRPLQARVRELSAGGDKRVVGVAFDGDADRSLFVDETGATISGDHTMLALAVEKKRRGTLAGDTLVGTVMSNAGLEKALRHEGITLLRAAVGDRYVLETMRAGNFTFGGEQSGHVIDLERNTTGDGPMTAVALLSLVARERTTLHELTWAMHVFPQILVNVRAPRQAAEQDEVRAAIARVERELGEDGRILVRPSGTEPLVRVMIEGDDRGRIERLAHEVAETVKRAAQ